MGLEHGLDLLKLVLHIAPSMHDFTSIMNKPL